MIFLIRAYFDLLEWELRGINKIKFFKKIKLFDCTWIENYLGC